MLNRPDYRLHDLHVGSRMAKVTVLCSWRRHFALTVPLFTQVYKWVPVNCWGNLTNCGGVTCDGLASRLGEVEILPAASCYRNRDKLRQLWASLGSKASLFFPYSTLTIYNFHIVKILTAYWLHLLGHQCWHHEWWCRPSSFEWPSLVNA